MWPKLMQFLVVGPQLARSVRVLESFGHLSKLKLPFSRTWKVLEKRGFSRWLRISFGLTFEKLDVAQCCVKQLACQRTGSYVPRAR